MIEPLTGIKEWRNEKNGFYIFRLHYTADPKKRSPEWKAKESQGIPTNDWNREYEIDFASFTGKPVFLNDYDDNRMCRKVQIDPKAPLLRSWDFGFHHPAVCWGQFHEGVQLRILQSDMGDDIDFRLYVRRVLTLTSQWFPGRQVLDCCDRAGAFKSTTVGEEETRILTSEFGIVPRYRYFRVPYTLDLMRKLMKGTHKHEPCFIVNDTESNFLLREALKGGYHYAEPKHDHPEKEEPFQDGYYENIVDPVRYLVANFLGTEGNHMSEMQKISMIDIPPAREFVW